MVCRSTFLLCFATAFFSFSATAQDRPKDAAELVRSELVGHGYVAEDLADLVVKDQYRDAHNGVEHIFLRQRWHGIEVFNGDIAVHRMADGRVLKMNNAAWPFVTKTVDATDPVLSAEQAMTMVLNKDLPGSRIPQLVRSEDQGRQLIFDGAAFDGEGVKVQLMYQPTDSLLRLVWNVNYYSPGGANWWNVRVSAINGKELERNDWVSECGFDEALERKVRVGEEDAAMPLPAAPLDYNVYPLPVESPSHGSRGIRNAPWAAAGVASPYGWHDTNGANGAEYTITRGNNVHAQEDANGNNGTGYSPNGGASLDFDFPINLTQQPSTYQDAAITNLFYWNNLMHDVWYQYGFNEVSGNFQQNNYGRGGTGADYVLADAQDGSGTNNANFGTPPDGSAPRMQMFLWNETTPNRDGDLDAGIIAHEYGHGISNRLVGGPSNVNCLNNAEQMGEGWSDFFGLMMTMQSGDTRTAGRGIGTYVLGEPITGLGIRPSPYSTSFAVNNFTYVDTRNASYSSSHDIGFIWCTILWEMTWDLIDQYGFDPDLYNGTGGNNRAMQLVIDGLKLTPCSPGFVDGRDAILAADAVNNGGANQSLIWSAFARRGLGFSASQGSSSSLNDQTEAFDLPSQNDVGAVAATPGAGNMFVCAGSPITVKATVRNFGQSAQSGFSIRYSLDGGPYVSEAFPGTLAAGATQVFTFAQAISISTVGAHTLVVSTQLTGDETPSNDQVQNTINAFAAVQVAAPFSEDVQGGVVAPTGWTLENPDNGTTWTTAAVTNGATCSSTTAWTINYNTYNAGGQEDRLVTPKIDLSGAAGTRLKFDHAYARYSSGYYDRFRVDISNDCGGSWSTLYDAEGSVLATAPDNTGANWQPSNCSQWQGHDIDLAAYDGQVVILRFVGICGYGQRLFLDNVSVESTGVTAAIRLYLDGTYNSAEHRMNDQLRTGGQIPSAEPYTAMGFALPGGGGEALASSLLNSTGDDALVDWVVVELRSATDPTQVVATRCALLKRNGDVIGPDGSSTLSFAAAAGNYHVAVRHRNHLGCMTALPVVFGSTAPAVDFSLSATATYGTDARRERDGRWMLWAGNANGDGTLSYTGVGNEREPILQIIGGSNPTLIVTGYYSQDINLDGEVKYTGAGNDRDALLQNIGGSTPTAVRTEQVP